MCLERERKTGEHIVLVVVVVVAYVVYVLDHDVGAFVRHVECCVARSVSKSVDDDDDDGWMDG